MMTKPGIWEDPVTSKITDVRWDSRLRTRNLTAHTIFDVNHLILHRFNTKMADRGDWIFPQMEYDILSQH